MTAESEVCSDCDYFEERTKNGKAGGLRAPIVSRTSLRSVFRILSNFSAFALVQALPAVGESFRIPRRPFPRLTTCICDFTKIRSCRVSDKCVSLRISILWDGWRISNANMEILVDFGFMARFVRNPQWKPGRTGCVGQPRRFGKQSVSSWSARRGRMRSARPPWAEQRNLQT